jgi:PAS domain S-box-containing protein
LASLVIAIVLSLLLRGYLYPRPLLLLALVLTLWGRGLGPGLVGAAFATIAVRVVYPELVPAYGMVSDFAMFILAAVAFATFSRAQMLVQAQRRKVEEELRANQRRFMDAQRLAQVGSWERYFEGDALYWSDEMFHIFGLPVGPPPDFSMLMQFVHADDRQKMRDGVARARTSGQPSLIEYRIVRPDGQTRFIRSIVEVMDDGFGKAVRTKGALQDVTEETLAKTALRESEHKFRAIFDQAGVGIAQVGLQGEWLALNDRICEIFGYQSSELIGKSFLDITHPDDLATCRKAFRDYLDQGLTSWSGEKRYLHKNGFPVWVKLSVSDVRDESGRPEYFVAIVEDITAQKQAGSALLDTERRLRLAQSVAPMGVWELDLVTNTGQASSEYFALYGLPPDHPPLTLPEWLDLLHPDDRSRMDDTLRRSLHETHFWDTEFRVVWPDGTVHWLLGKGRVFLDDAGRPVRLAGVNLDITERKQTQAALHESEDRFRNMADAAPVMIWAAGPDRRCSFFSRRWLEFTGRTMEQEIGDGWTQGVHPEDLERCLSGYAAAFDDRRDLQLEYRLRRADGEYRWLLFYGVPRMAPGGIFAGYIGSAVDVHDLKRTQEETLARNKLESLGVLSAGIAHDFNNLLGSIIAQAELAETSLPDGAVAPEEIRQIKSVAIRAAEIVRELMIYSGQDRIDLDQVDVSQLVEEMLQLLKVSISKHASLKTTLGSGLPAVMGNAAQIRQMVMNLILNASEAIGEKDGLITVTTSRVRDLLRLEVSDTGRGMTERERLRVFDPFFSTKFAGRGLGLSVVQGVVRAHGGTIHLTSSPGQGTTFEILLPAEVESPAKRNRESAGQARHHVGTLLLIEDEDLLRQSVAKMLCAKGFSVIQAADGSAALARIRGTEPMDAILIDMTIPGASSYDVISEAARLRPGVKIILTSAYSREMVSRGLDAPQIRGFIRKPFKLGDLIQLLSDVLSS